MHKNRKNTAMAALLILALLATRLAAAAEAASGPTGIDSLRVEYSENPLGIDELHPRLSWQLRSSARGVAQSAFEIRVARDEASLRAAQDLTWDSGKIASSQSIQYNYAGPALQSRQRYFWQVRVWDAQGQDLGWSAAAHWEMGLVNSTEWSASWIASGIPSDPTVSGQPPMLRRDFQLKGPVKSARVYVTAHGMYELFLNGQRVGDAVLTPGWTSYNHRLQYFTYDVTDRLKGGANAIGAYLGNGWYRGVVGFTGTRNHYGDQLALLLQLEVVYQDGQRETISSDDAWKSSTGPILMSEIYDGETYDARQEKSGWSVAGFDAHDWAPAKRVSASKDVLVAPESPPMRRHEEFKAKKIFRTPAGDTVVDFGQNLVGWVRLKANGAVGSTVMLRHAEVLDKSGNFYTDNLRSAQQSIRYTLKGGGEESYEPHFTFQGFRYVAVSGYPGKLTPASLTAIAIYTDMAPTAEFATSKPLINQLEHNIQWGQKGNFLDVPTDCPQRDERLGWTGDAQVFSPTAAFNMDVAAFFTKWMKDVAADQMANGSVPFVVPDVLTSPSRPAPTGGERGTGGAAGWADAATIIPWNMYLAYGDTRILEAQYASMQRWVDYEQSRAGADDIWKGDFHFGDWLDFFSTAKNTRFGSTSTDLIATAYFARSTDILQRAAKILGKEKDAARYAESLEKIKVAFQKQFITADGSVGEGTQTAYVLALDFDLVPEGLQATVAAKLAQDVRERGHLTTGFLGTPHLLNVLSRFGYTKEAYLLLNREEFPSWLYPVKQGATTIWERWDGLKPDGSFENKDMNSFNHYAYGAVGDWMYEVLGGINIDPAAPGYKHVLIQPKPGGGFKHASTSHVSPYGRIATSWKLKGRNLELEVMIPPNSSATVRLPQTAPSAVTEGGRVLASGSGITSVAGQGADTVVEVGSGRYVFKYPASGLK
jgi:alpha-L-rhamnosidase